MKKSNKFLSLILAILMIVSVMPMAFAADTDVNSADYTAYDAATERFVTIVEQTFTKLAYSTNEYIEAELLKMVDKYFANTDTKKLTTEEEQYILDSMADELNGLSDTLEEGIANGTLVKADYTEINKAIEEFINTHSSEEYNALVAEIIADYNAMTAKNHETAADAADIAAIEAKMNETEDCDHLCHDDGIMGFIWKIINFFLKRNPVCECGMTHYGHASAPAEFVPVKFEAEDPKGTIVEKIVGTLENPEFVSADNEATNVLANGD